MNCGVRRVTVFPGIVVWKPRTENTLVWSEILSRYFFYIDISTAVNVPNLECIMLGYFEEQIGSSSFIRK
jgi:hypothetical protein